jgi:hypothetical protein
MAGDPEQRLTGGTSSSVHRRGDEVLRSAQPWSTTTVGLLSHLERAGFSAAPHPVGDGFAADGRERLAFIDGEPQADRPWSDVGIFELGRLHRELHDAAATYRPDSPRWSPGWPRGLPQRDTDVVIGHGDPGPWNVLGRDDRPIALIDWDSAGPVGRRWAVAEAAWLNAHLYDDDVAERHGLPSPTARARHVGLFADGYGLEGDERARLVDDMVEVSLRSAAHEATVSGVTPDGPTRSPAPGAQWPFTGDVLTWTLAWRVRSARWMLDHAALLSSALARPPASGG